MVSEKSIRFYCRKRIKRDALKHRKLHRFYETTNELIDYSGMKLSGREYTREMVRIRDNRTCQKCNKKWKEGKRRFDVHHLNELCGKKSRGYDSINDVVGLITLCHKCHLNLDSVREKMRGPRENRLVDNSVLLKIE